MKWSMMLTEQHTQFNMEPENEHEKELFRLLSKFNHGTVVVSRGVTIGPNQAGYMREWSRGDEVCAITLSKPKPATLDPLPLPEQ